MQGTRLYTGGIARTAVIGTRKRTRTKSATVATHEMYGSLVATKTVPYINKRKEGLVLSDPRKDVLFMTEPVSLKVFFPL